MVSEVYTDNYSIMTIRYIAVKNASRFLSQSPIEQQMDPEDKPFLAAECSISIGIEALQESIYNSAYRTDTIGFWQYGKPSLDITRDETLLAWWQNFTRGWDRLAPTAEELQELERPKLPPGFNFGVSAYSSLYNFIADAFHRSHLQAELGSLVPSPTMNGMSYAVGDIQMGSHRWQYFRVCSRKGQTHMCRRKHGKSFDQIVPRQRIHLQWLIRQRDHWKNAHQRDPDRSEMEMAVSPSWSLGAGGRIIPWYLIQDPESEDTDLGGQHPASHLPV